MWQGENAEEGKAWRKREKTRGDWVFVRGSDDGLDAHSARPQRASVTLEDELPRYCLRPSVLLQRITWLPFVGWSRRCSYAALRTGRLIPPA